MSRAGDELGALVLLVLLLGMLVAMVVAVASAASMAIAKVLVLGTEWYARWRVRRAARATLGRAR